VHHARGGAHHIPCGGGEARGVGLRGRLVGRWGSPAAGGSGGGGGAPIRECSCGTVNCCLFATMHALVPAATFSSSPPNASPMHWWPMQTPNSGKSGPSSLTACSEMPESVGLPVIVERVYRTLSQSSGVELQKHTRSIPKTVCLGCCDSWTPRQPASVRKPTACSPGPGDTKMPAGFIARISSTVFSSFLNTTNSAPRSPKYCGGERKKVCSGGQPIRRRRACGRLNTLTSMQLRSTTGQTGLRSERGPDHSEPAHLTEVVREAVVVVDNYNRSLCSCCNSCCSGSPLRAADPRTSCCWEPCDRRKQCSW